MMIAQLRFTATCCACSIASGVSDRDNSNMRYRQLNLKLREPRKSASTDTISLQQGLCSIVNLKQEEGVHVPMKFDMMHNHKPKPHDDAHYVKM